MNLDPFEEKKIPVHPFVFFLRILLGIIKVPFFLVFFTLLFIYQFLIQIIPSPVIKRIFSRGCHIVFFKILLFLTGNYTIYEDSIPLSDYYFDFTDLPNINSGDLIISNFASYLNIFWFQYRYSPIYAIPVSSTSVVLKSWVSLLATIWTNDILSKGKQYSLSEAIKIAREQYAPLVIFPEGVPTNGNQIISFFPFGKNVNFNDMHIHIIGFIHKSLGESPNYVMNKKRDGFSHLFFMLCRFHPLMKICYALPQDVPPIDNGISNEWISKSRLLISKVLCLPLVDQFPPEEFFHFKNHND